MVKCALKTCTNNSLKQKKKDGVSYFKFPRNPIQREKWRQIVAVERNDEVFKPNGSSVVCSDHFAPTDIYYSDTGKKIMKKKAAVPVLINVSPQQSTACQEQRTGLVNYISEFTKTLEHVKVSFGPSTSKDVDMKPSTSADNNISDSTSIQPSGLIDNDEKYSTYLQTTLDKTEDTSSDLACTNPKKSPTSSEINLLNTAKTTFLKKKLQDTRRKLLFKMKQVKNLKRQNDRLKKKYATLKEVMKIFMKRRIVDEA